MSSGFDAAQESRSLSRYHIIQHLLLEVGSTNAGAWGSEDVLSCIEAVFDLPSTRLAVYGSLAPGEPNHWVLADLPGRWSEGSVRGRLVQQGWGSKQGFPGMVRDPVGATIPVCVLESPALPQRWTTLDQFEGAEYQRILTTVEQVSGLSVSCIYALRDARRARRR